MKAPPKNNRRGTSGNSHFLLCPNKEQSIYNLQFLSMSKVIMSMNGLCTWMALYHNTSSGQLCTRHCTPVGEDPQTNTMTSDKCLNEVETISSNEPNIFLNYSTLNSKHNRVTTQSRNQQNMHLPISTTESRPEVQFSCFRNLS